MAQQESTSQDLADLLATRNFDTEYKNAQGQDAPPNDATTFSFDYKSSAGNNYGTVVILFSDEGEIMLFSNDKLGKTMDSPEDKKEWFGFVQQLSEFATRHNFNNFTPLNINQLKHTMAGMAAIKEGLFEGYYGTRKTSYMGEQTAARLVIKHNRMLGENDKRYRYVESLFIETADGEKFKLPFTKLSGGRAMLEHVKNGGKTYDIRGSHICELVEEMNVLARFNRASQQRMFEGLTQDLVETAHNYYYALKENLQHISTGQGYKEYFESWTPADIGDETALVEDLKTMFIEQTLDARIEAALPTLAKIQQRGNAMKEAEIFENWVNNIMEGTWALPDTPEAQAKLDELMSQELIVGPDATNAKEQLYDVIGDDKLFDILADLAEQDPRANCWDDTDVQARLQELGIQMNTTPDAEQQQPVAPAAGQQAPGTAPEQGMAEAAKWRDPQYKGKLYTQEPGDSDEYDSIDYGYEIGLRPENDPGQKRRMGGVGSKYDRTDPLVKGFGRYGVGEPVSKGPRKGLPSRDQITSLKQSIRDISGKHPRPNLPEQGIAEGQLDEFDIDALNQLASHPGIGVAASAGGAALGGLIGKGIEKTANYFQKKKQDKAYDNLKQQGMAEAIPAAGVDPKATQQYAQQIVQALQQATGATVKDFPNQDGTVKIVINPDPNDRTYPPSRGYIVPTGNDGATMQNITKAINPYYNTFRQKGWRFDQPVGGAFTIGIPTQQAVAENAELATMLKYAGVPVSESRIHENSEYTYEKVAKILARENPGLATDKNSNEFYSAVYHELIAIGMTPKAARNLISYDEDFMSDVASAYAHYQSNPGLDESNSGMIMPEADPMATVEAMPDLSAPVLEGTCNATMEGEYCPEHGLAECGMYEMGTVAGSMAPVIGEAPQDPINYNGAITGSYYESKSDTALLARIKSLALLK
jgi:hypothetical protein